MKTGILAGLVALLAATGAAAAEERFKFPPVKAPQAASKEAEGADLAFGAFQRGYFLTAFDEATRRVEKDHDPVAMLLLGELYSQGLGVPRDLTKAAAWYGQAAQRGNKDAIFAYGMAKLNGPDPAIKDPAQSGIPKDESGAVLLLNRAAELGVPSAAYNLGIIALRPSNGTPDYATAARRFKEAAQSGNADALFSLGVLAKEGKGMKADLPEAAGYFEAAAKDGNLEAMIEYAIMLFNGQGVDEDREAAAGWLEKAAGAGSPLARNRLARLYVTGQGVAPNPVLAGAWHMLARGSGMADKDLDRFIENLSDEQKEAALERARALGL